MKRKGWIAGCFIFFLGLLLAFGAGAAPEKPIKLGVMFVMSGPMGGYGKHGKQAVQMALEEINADGGIQGRKVEAIFADDEMKVDKGIQIAKKFINEDQVDFIIGPTSSAVALALADLVEQQKKILVLTQSATNSLTDAKFNPYLFSTLSNAMMHSRAGAYFLANKPYKRWMCIGPGYSYGQESWNSFKTKLTELRPDVEIVGELWPKLMETDYAPFIKQILETKPDAVWSPLWGMDAVNFIKQALPLGLFDKIKFAFPDGAALESLMPLGKSMPEGVFVAARYFFLTPDAPVNRRFVKAYTEKFKELPDYMAEETYAGVYFLRAAIERAGTTDSETIIEAVEDEPLAWETPEGWKIMRKEDHQVVEDVVWGETIFSEKYGFAILKNMQSIPAEEICRTPEELKEVQSNYEKRISGQKK
jgi:branched-chain amino acid transport system substrate-binding protein